MPDIKLLGANKVLRLGWSVRHPEIAKTALDAYLAILQYSVNQDVSTTLGAALQS